MRIMKNKRDKKLNVLKKANNIKLRFKSVINETEEVVSKGCRINLIFNKEAVVDGCKAVSDYGGNRITLKVEGGMIMFDGNDLYLYSFDSGCAVIRGTISNISYNT